MVPSTCCVYLVCDATVMDVSLFFFLTPILVNLPCIVAHTTMDAESVAIMREHLNEFLAFLAKEQKRFFVHDYEDPSPAYHRLNAT